MNKKELGKKSRQAGMRFEKKVREELEKRGWIVDKWTNNVEFLLEDLAEKGIIGGEVGKLIPAKPKFIFNPKTRTRQMIGNSSGFPDFIAFRNIQKFGYFTDFRKEGPPEKGRIVYKVVGVESKMNGKLDKEEKEKCKWLLNNNIFSKILIASKGEKRGEIKFIQVEGGKDGKNRI